MFKFKDQNLWNMGEPFEWSSQPIDQGYVQSIVWDENGVGKIVRAELTSYGSSFGYDYQVYSNGNLENVTFKAGAFESEQLPKRPREHVPPPKRPREALPPGVSPNIYIFGEIHGTAEDQKSVLTQKFLEKGFFVLGEGFQTGENQGELDDPYADLRASILLAFLHNSVQYDTMKTISLVTSMLKIDEPPLRIGPLPDLRMLNENREASAELQIALSQVEFDYKDLYEYYFKDDEYEKAMTTLFNLRLFDIFSLLTTAENSPHWGVFTIIMQDAREDKMIERIRMRAPRGVAVFTGLKHMPKLVDALSSDNVVQAHMLPLSEPIGEITSIGGGAGGAASQFCVKLRF